MRWEPLQAGTTPAAAAAAAEAHNTQQNHEESEGQDDPIGVTVVPYSRIVRLMGGRNAESSLRAPEPPPAPPPEKHGTCAKQSTAQRSQPASACLLSACLRHTN